MSFLKSVFANASTNAELTEENQSLTKDVKRLETKVETLTDELKAERRANQEYMYKCDRDSVRDKETFEYEQAREKERHSQEVIELTNRALVAESDAESRIEREVKAAVSNARLEIRAEYEDDLEELREENLEMGAAESAALAKAEQIQEVVKSLQGQLKDYREFTQFVMEKLPKVDLSKFNINVDVPPTKVEVVSQGGGKKN